MSGPSTSSVRRWSRWHAVLEQYTPDGSLGRIILGLTSATASLPLLVVGLIAIASFSPVPFVTGLLAVTGGVATGILAIQVLWPVYLSLIGNIDSSSAYAHGESLVGRTFSRPDDPVAVLKREYAAGELSHEEFERRLSRLLDADERTPSDDESSAPNDGYQHSEAGSILERER